MTITDQNNCSVTLNDVATIIEPDVFEFDITLETINSFVSPALCEYGNSASGQIEIDIDFLNSFITGGTLPYSNGFI